MFLLLILSMSCVIKDKIPFLSLGFLVGIARMLGVQVAPWGMVPIPSPLAQEQDSQARMPFRASSALSLDKVIKWLDPGLAEVWL